MLWGRRLAPNEARSRMLEWDDAKDAVNRETHGIGFREAERIDWATSIETIDDQRVALGSIDGRRLSLRKPGDREIRRYDARRGTPYD